MFTYQAVVLVRNSKTDKDGVSSTYIGASYNSFYFRQLSPFIRTKLAALDFLTRNFRTR